MMSTDVQEKLTGTCRQCGNKVTAGSGHKLGCAYGHQLRQAEKVLKIAITQGWVAREETEWTY